MIDNYYAFFESMNYASEDTIREFRSIYLPFVKPFQEQIETPIAVDMGCGRGEWLEMLHNLGFDAKGVDIDQGMLRAAQKKGLNVELGDGLDYLKRIPDHSVAVASAFHVLEHLPFNEVLSFFEQCKRILIPGGLLIAETPNPENLHVATSNFYLDPTHLRPIPILQMISIARFFGYSKYSILRLQEQKDLYQKSDITFRDLFYGVSKDYGLIAQKDGGTEGLNVALDHPMRYETGIGIDEMIKRLDERLERLSRKVESLQASSAVANEHKTKD